MKTTRKDFNLFKKTFLYWQHKLGLTHYEVIFKHEHIQEDTWADILINEDGKIATVRFNTSYGDYCKAELNPARSGRHEAIHLLINRLGWLGSCRYIETSDLNEENEAIVRRLEKVL